MSTQLSATPTVITVTAGETIEFGQSGIVSPKWTLEGNGSLSQLGVFTAPSTPQTVRVRVHSSAWEAGYNEDHWILHPDDRMEAENPEGMWWHGISSTGRLNDIGDYLVWESPASSSEMYWTGVWQASGAYGGVYIADGRLRSYDTLTSEDFANPTWEAGDRLKFEVNASLGLDVYINDEFLGSSTRSHTAPYYFLTTLPMPDGTLVTPPQFFGAGISGYTEYFMDVEVVIPPRTFPLEFAKLSSGTQFVTTVTSTGISGREQRIRHRRNGRDTFNAAFSIRELEDVAMLRDFYLACGGKFETFLITDPLDYRFDRMFAEVTGDSANTEFQLRRKYTDYLGNFQYKDVRRPKSGTIQVWVDNVPQTEGADYLIDYQSTGKISFEEAPAANAVIEFAGEFYKNCRFDTDSLDLQILEFWVDSGGADYALVQPPEILLIEVFT